MTSTLQTYKTGLDTLLATNDMEYHFTDAKKAQWANWAGERVVAHFDWHWIKKAVEFAHEENQEWYNLDDDNIRLDGIFRVTSGPDETEKEHEIVDFDRYQDLKKDKTNYVATILGRQVFYSPQTTVGDPVGLYGKAQWETLVDNADESIIPSSYDEAVQQFMLGFAHQDSMNPEEATKAFKQAETILDRKVVTHTNDQPAGYAGVIRSSRFN